MKTHWKNLSNFDYFGAYSFNESKEAILTIKEVKRERVTNNTGSSEDCVVVKFDELRYNGIVVKPMIMNKTNCKIIEELYGEFVEDWLGKKVIVYVTTTKVARETVPCLRIKREIPTFKCVVCGKEIEEKIYNGALAKYGVAVCSAECLEKNNKGGNE